MAAVSVTQQDADRAIAFAAEAKQIYINGSAVGASPVTDSLFPDAAAYDSFGVQDNYVKALVLALVRIWKNGPSTFPVLLPPYVKSALPSAAANLTGMIYVVDEVGGAVPAFSDGTNWRRVTDRAVVS
jgi:hypothetical protein